MADIKPPPARDEVELSLFGPGVGECAVLHLCGGEWVVVDSCTDRGWTRPVALRYLENIGVDPATAVRMVVVTHWHDDHIRGVSQIVRTAQAAQVVCSAALNVDEFYRLVAASQQTMMAAPGTDEFSQILEILEQRAPAGVRPAAVGPVWATANQRLWQRSASNGNPAGEVFALSPSAASMTLALRGFGALLPQPGTPKRRLVALGPNESAVVLSLRIGDVQILLGSDLEASSNPAVGWQAIITSAAKPAGIARIFKVPHHGSANADDPEVWSTLLVADPYAVLTPFTRGRALPTPADVARLRIRTPNGYITALGQGWNPPRRDPAVEKTMKEVGRDRKALIGPTGHIRLRVHHGLATPVRVELFDGAIPL